MSKLIKKYEEFLNDTETAPAEHVTKPETEEEGMPVRRGKKLGQPSVSPDPLALADLKNGISNPKIIDNEYLYNDVYRIAYPSETNSYTVNHVTLSDDPQSVIDYINQKENAKKSDYVAEYETPELSDVTVGEDGELDGFNFDEDPEKIAAKGGSTEGQPGREGFRKDSKSYKSSRKFNKRK